jgi:MoaA/NifB/PqqE/SkfB family radical SAM enzyme
MNFDFFKRVVKEMREAGVEELGVFYLGESFLCKWLPDAIRFAKEECGYPYVFLTTNGSLATPAKVVDCFEAGLDSLKFSLNYADEEQFKEVADVKGSLFYKIKENLIQAYHARNFGHYDCGLYASYIEYDGEQGEKINEYLDSVRPYVDELYALPLYNQAALVENDEWSFVQGNRGRLDNLRDPLPCWSIFTEGHISFDGRLSACCFDHDNRFNMGDLNEVSFMEAWHSNKFQDLRKKHLEKDVTGTICEECVIYD